MSKQLTQSTLLKEEFYLVQTSRDTKTSKTNNKGGSDCFHCGDPNHWAYEYPQLYEEDNSELIPTNENGRRVHTQVSEVVKY